MAIRHWNLSTIAALWAIDIFVLLMLWPVDGVAASIGPVLLMWIVPSVPLFVITVIWIRARRSTDQGDRAGPRRGAV